MNRSVKPASAKTSASPIVATVRPTAPASIWRRATAMLLCVFACGPQRDASLAHEPRHRLRSVRPSGRDRRRPPACRARQPRHRRGIPGSSRPPSRGHLPRVSAVAPFVGRYRSGAPVVGDGQPVVQEGVGDVMTISPGMGLALESIEDLDPVLWEAMVNERRRQHDKIELIASENYVVRGRDGSAGLVADQQVRRGPARQALLRRLRVRGYRRATRPGACARPLPGRRARERPAALGRAGQHGGLLQRPRTGRPDHGHEPGPRRPPDPWHGPQLLRAAVRGPCLRRAPGHGAHRLRRDGDPGARRSARS